MEIEYQESKRKTIDPLHNEWGVPYTRPLIGLQGRPNHRYKSICGRIPSTGDESNQILATLRNELERFRNDRVSIILDIIREVLGIGGPNELARNLYLYLREVWLPKHHTYFENAKRKQLGDQRLNAITNQIRESPNRSEIARAGKGARSIV